MKVAADVAVLGRSKWYEYLVRFAFGGAVTALAGIVAKHYGPEIGGLFLAFPAIFPATATLLEKHAEKGRGDKHADQAKKRARVLAGVDAAGAAMGTLTLAAFGATIWWGLPNHSPALVLSAASAVWILIAFCCWWCRKRLFPKLRRSLKQQTLKAGTLMANKNGSKQSSLADPSRLRSARG